MLHSAVEQLWSDTSNMKALQFCDILETTYSWKLLTQRHNVISQKNQTFQITLSFFLPWLVGRNGKHYHCSLSDIYIYIYWYIFVNCKWVATRWQLYNTHLHTNNTQNNTKQTIHSTTQNLRTIQKFWKSAGRAPTWRVIPWHLPYNWGKSMEKPQSERQSSMVAMVTGCFYEVCAQALEIAWFYGLQWNCLFTANGTRHLGKPRRYKQDIYTTKHY
jgi:hypothetical protein